MPAYTSVLQKPLETIFWEDDNFMEELLQVVRLFGVRAGHEGAGWR